MLVFHSIRFGSYVNSVETILTVARGTAALAGFVTGAIFLFAVVLRAVTSILHPFSLPLKFIPLLNVLQIVISVLTALARAYFWVTAYTVKETDAVSFGTLVPCTCTFENRNCVLRLLGFSIILILVLIGFCNWLIYNWCNVFLHGGCHRDITRSRTYFEIELCTLR